MSVDEAKGVASEGGSDFHIIWGGGVDLTYTCAVRE